MEVDIPSIRQSAAEDGVACQFDKCGRSRPMFRRMSDLVSVVSDNHQAGYAHAWFRRSRVSRVRSDSRRTAKGTIVHLHQHQMSHSAQITLYRA